MRRLALLLLVVTFGAARAEGQENARVHLETSLHFDSTTGTSHPVIRTVDLIPDPRVAAMLASGFPLRLHYRLETYRSRSGWIDAFVRQTEWDVVVRHEPLLDQYQVAEVFRFNQRSYRYAGLEELGRGLGTPREIRVGPREGGVYYYVVTLEVTTLSASDLKELEQFLSGEVGPTTTGGEPIGAAIGNAIRRVLISVASLPDLRVEKRTAQFIVR